MDHPLPWLKYLDANDLADEQLDLQGLPVESPTGEHLGRLEGFIVDVSNGRPYYAVVDAGGWFKSKDYLLPIGQTRLDTSREALIADLNRDRIDRFPGFDKAVFESASQDALRRFNDETSFALTGEAWRYAETEHFSAAWSRPEFRHPDWWSATRGTGAEGRSGIRSGVDDRIPTMSDLTRPVDRQSDVRDQSPHDDGRAQPGDVLGIETGGETTRIGETTEDENRRRRDTERPGTNERG